MDEGMIFPYYQSLSQSRLDILGYEFSELESPRFPFPVIIKNHMAFPLQFTGMRQYMLCYGLEDDRFFKESIKANSRIMAAKMEGEFPFDLFAYQINFELEEDAVLFKLAHG